MPGGRLTQQERQKIALGLAEDLPYAEIARRLDRPTSTVTREVDRNGGPTAYRADQAHRATEHRARRRKQAQPQGQQPLGRREEAVRAYEESFTALLVHQGLPRMTARVLTSLFVADTGSLTAAELARHLDVSPASVSKAIAFLDEQGLIRRERDERRRERYFVDEDVWYQSTIAAAQGVAQVARTAREGVTVLGRESAAAARLENIARFSDFISESMLRAAEQVRDILHTKPEPAGG
ncbi:helix-turn-helix domain-containing protein [Kitasatospora sp. NPDC002227]|uniref:helix-turn-helix domain-containing protein n=1 Tax=Kitasatospora sp. NPDC002227 TaxID=3154773 RepID=UPI00332C39C5